VVKKTSGEGERGVAILEKKRKDLNSSDGTAGLKKKRGEPIERGSFFSWGKKLGLTFIASKWTTRRGRTYRMGGGRTLSSMEDEPFNKREGQEDL